MQEYRLRHTKKCDGESLYEVERKKHFLWWSWWGCTYHYYNTSTLFEATRQIDGLYVADASRRNPEYIFREELTT